ncbi:hypothetical protein PLESTF_000313000 [Pleodorina starrii]|nr:hypothetical protein PLESTM_000683000 [Pleodorina starrii]GLC65563.1 hypothetical protein PLESTF_000313000 [Pleodorina starrii]
MGNNASLPEKVYSAVQRNDLCEFQNLVAELDTAGASKEARDAVLEYKDKSGRTPLLVAASKNHYQVLQQLIRLGADLSYINPCRDSPGGALHEAAARRHEAAVELLLAAGANPFAANAAGRTALDEAVLSGHSGVVRAIEKYAEFSGTVAFKIRAMGGLSSKYKARWAVLMPYLPFRSGSGSKPAAAAAAAEPQRPPPPPPSRRLLWLYKDKASVSPRCRLWVDGAVVETKGPAGTDGSLRLHTSHGEPVGDLATTYSHGYCVAFRPADLTPAAAAVHHRLVTLLSSPPPPPPPPSPSPLPQQQPQATGLPVAIPNAVPYPPTPPPPALAQPGAATPPPPPPPFYPLVAPVVAFGGGSVLLVPPPPPQAAAGGVPAPAAAAAVPQGGGVQPQAYPGAAGPCPMASPLSLHQHQQQQQQQQRQRQATPGAAGAAPGAAAAAAAGRPRRGSEESVSGAVSGAGEARPAGAAACEPAVLGRGRGGEVVGERFIEGMAALPGESDEAFAARLASAISITSGHSQDNLFPQQQQPLQLQRSARSETASEPTSSSSNLAPPPFAAQTTPGALRQQQRQSDTALSHGPGAAAAASRLTSGDGGGGLSLINFHSDPGNGPQGGPAGASAASAAPSRSGGGVGPQRPGAQRPAQGPRGDDDDDLDMDTVNALIAAAGGAAAAGTPGGTPAAPQARSPCSAAAAPSAPPAYALDGHPAASPHRPAAAAAAPPSSPSPADSEWECIICLNAAKEVGFLHGDTVHRCVCRACSVHIEVGAPCPLCRQPVERVLGVY